MKKAEAYAPQLECLECGTKYDVQYMISCPKCGGLLSVIYPYDYIAEKLNAKALATRVPGVWKYRELLPAPKSEDIVSLGEGGTFLHNCPRLAKEIGIKKLYIKDETTNPTGSFLDRGSTVLITKALELGFKEIYCVAKGNLGASLSAYAAKAGMNCSILAPKEIDLGKLYQIIAYNANVKLVESFDKTLREVEKSREKTYFVTMTDPFFLEGEKTTAIEITEQLGWRLPDRMFIPVGTGGHISQAWKAVKELSRVGILKNKSVKMCGVQVEGFTPIVEAIRKGRELMKPIQHVHAAILEISLENPPYGSMALKAIRESGGTAIDVSNQEILDAIRLLASNEGIFAEPAAASTIAGLRKLIETGEVDKNEEVVCVITGEGLKDPITARKFVKRISEIEKTIKQTEKRQLMIRIGETKEHILQILSEKEQHGYGVWKLLKEKFGYETKIPSVYQHLIELSQLGLIEKTVSKSISGRPKRNYYCLTPKGKELQKTLEKLKI